MTNMNLLAYLVTLGNLQSLQSSDAPAVENLSVKFGDLHSLEHDLLAMPELNIEDFRETGYYRVGNTGRYLSKNLRDFMYDGIGNPNDEGVIFTVLFNENNRGKSVGTTLPVLMKDKDPKDVREEWANYLDKRYARRERSLVDMLRT